MTWRDHAACLGLDTEMFYAHEEARNATVRDRVARPAFDVCATCTVRQQCLEAALKEPGSQHGIRAGTFARTRTALVLDRKRAS